MQSVFGGGEEGTFMSAVKNCFAKKKYRPFNRLRIKSPSVAAYWSHHQPILPDVCGGAEIRRSLQGLDCGTATLMMTDYLTSIYWCVAIQAVPDSEEGVPVNDCESGTEILLSSVGAVVASCVLLIQEQRLLEWGELKKVLCG